MATAMQLQQSNPAAHLLQITLVVAPSKPATHVLRQLATRKIRLPVYSRLYAIYYLRRKCLTTDIHASNLITHSPCVQQKMWDMISLEKGDYRAKCLVEIWKQKRTHCTHV
jgi:hypothetical protein